MNNNFKILKPSTVRWIGVVVICISILLGTAEKNKDIEEIIIRQEKLTPLLLQKLISALKGQYPLFSFLKNNAVIADGRYKQGNLRSLLILSPQETGKVLWLNSDISWLACSPGGRYIAYPEASDKERVWVLDLETNRAKPLASAILEGKILSYPRPWFVDDSHLIIERGDKKTWEEYWRKADLTPLENLPPKYLSKKELEQYYKLSDLFLKGGLTPQQAQELDRLVREMAKRMSEGERQKLTEQYEFLKKVWSSYDIVVVNIHTNKEQLLIKGEEQIIGISQDRKGLYVEDKLSKKIFKIEIDKPTEKKELLHQGYPGLRIRSEEPLRFGFIYPPLQYFWITYPLAVYKCYCYEMRDKDPVLLRTINCGDSKFPPDSHISVSPQGNFSISYGKKGLFLKDLNNGKVKKITNEPVYGFKWSEDDSRLAYVVRGRKCYEIWLFDTSTSLNQRIFP